MFYPTLQSPEQRKETISTFRGYCHRAECPVGAFYHMENLSSDRFPTMSPRKPRGFIRLLTRPVSLAGKEKLAWIDGSYLYWDGTQVQGITLSTQQEDLPKQMVSMGAYLLVFPDGVYCNTEDLSDCGRLALRQSFACTAQRFARFAPCLEDGTEFNGFFLTPTEPRLPEDGSVWVNTGELPHTYYRYNAAAGGWEKLGAIYTKVEFPDGISGFRVGDWVTLSGCDSGEEGMGQQARALNGDHEILEIVNNKTIRFLGAQLDAICLQEAGTISISRAVPRMDYVTECGNRLWGCHYGIVDGKPVNEIYASALGDFKAWRQYKGLSTDSYCVSRGSDGPWTGAATYQNCPIFFKEGCMEKVYPSATGAHQVVTVSCRGIQPGSAGATAVVNGVLYYKASDGIYAYDGSLPVCVSRDLGEDAYGNAVGGGLGEKYYVSMTDSRMESHLFAYDTRRQMWHREDGLSVLAFARAGSELYGLTASGQILAMGGTVGGRESRISWLAETGVLGLDVPGQQVLSRLSLRLSPEKGADVDVWAEYDSSGAWVHKAHVTGLGLKSLVIPIQPQRCDHLRLRLTGRGMCTVYSLTLTREEGSDA